MDKPTTHDILELKIYIEDNEEFLTRIRYLRNSTGPNKEIFNQMYQKIEDKVSLYKAKLLLLGVPYE